MSWVYSAAEAAANENAAHALAQKFSDAAAQSEQRAEAEQRKADADARKAAADAQRAADETEMLRNAKEEAAARAAAEKARIERERTAARAQADRMAEDARRQRAELDRQAEDKRRAEAARLSREVEERRIADERRIAEEKRIAAAKAEAERKAKAARLAEERRKVEEARVAEIKRQAEAAEQKRRAEESRIVELKRLAEEADAKRRAEEQRLAEQRRIADAKSAEQRAALEAQREAEAQRIAEKFRIAREARERTKSTRSSLGGPIPDEQTAPPSPFIAPATTSTARTPVVKPSYPQRVTVLVEMQPRRHGSHMTSNPVLCVSDDCYVSNGAARAATLMRRASALGPKNTIGRNAGLCRHHTTCVFRGVTLTSATSSIQPVDLGFWRHDRREIRSVTPDRSCGVAPGGEIACSTPIEAAGYRAWIIPEAVADQAGPQALERALDRRLPVTRSASGSEWKSTVQALPTR